MRSRETWVTTVTSDETGETIYTVETTAGSYIRLTTGAEFTGVPAQVIYLDVREVRDLANALLRAAIEASS